VRHIILLTISLFCSFLHGKESGGIIGRVIDKQTQQPLAGVNISIVDTTLGTSTGLDGLFRITNLREDIYKLKFEIIGYAPLLETDIRVIRNKIEQLGEIELIESILETETVSVSAGIFREDQESIVSATHYNREEIRRSPGSANDVLRSIATIPGVSNSNGEYAAFSVRGSGPRDNLILVDNIPFEKVVHMDGSANEYEDAQGGAFSIFTPYLIEDAEFQGGGFSAKYGGKHSSLLKLNIREGNKETPTLRGAYDLLGWELNYDGPSYLFKNTRVNLSARRQDFKRVLQVAGFEEVGYPRLTDLIGKINSNIDANNTISILGVYGPEQFDRDAGHMLSAKKIEDTFLQKTKETRSLIGINWRMLTGSSSFLHSTFYYRRNDQVRNYGKAYPDLVNGQRPTEETIRQRPNIYLLDQQETEAGIKMDYTYQTDINSTFQSGIEVNRISLDFKQRQNGLDTLYTFGRNDFREDPTQNFIITTPEMVNADFNGIKSILAAYSEYSFYTLSGRLQINPGVRYQYSEFSEEHYFLPRLSASLRFDPRTRMNLAAGLYSQTPRFIDLASNVNNNSLKDEIAQHYILGFTRYLLDDLKFTAEVYYKTYDNLVVKNARTSEVRGNSGDGTAYGIDLSFVKKLVKKLYGQINYSYSQSKRNDHNGLGSYNYDFNRPHMFNLLAGYEFNKKWALSLKWNYTSGHPRDKYIIHENVHNNKNYLRYSQEIVSKNTDRSDPIHSLNVRIDYRHQFGPLGMIAFLDIFNLYNNTNANQVRFIERSGKQVNVGLGILPTFGLKFEL
jgi:CarboxypepD_reg-like domain/TonB-dependent Receptor Plug Domain